MFEAVKFTGDPVQTGPLFAAVAAGIVRIETTTSSVTLHPFKVTVAV